MKLTVLTVVILLLLSFSIVNQQELSGFQDTTVNKTLDLQKLEAQFKQIDEEPDSVEVDVSGNKESSGKMNIVVERKVSFVQNTGKEDKTKTKKETLVDIDLSKVDVPDEYINEKIASAFSTPARCGTLPSVKLSQIDASKIYEVVEDYIYNPGAYSITVLSGFKYDRASIPRIFWVVMDKDSLSNVPPLIHDLLYSHGGVLPPNQLSPYRKFSRKETDDIFLEIMTKCGVKKWRREAAYQAVRKFSGFAWND